MTDTTTRPATHALLGDVTPNRATIVMVGTEDDCRAASDDDRQVVARIDCETPDAGERAWIGRVDDEDGRACTRVVGRA